MERMRLNDAFRWLLHQGGTGFPLTFCIADRNPLLVSRLGKAADAGKRHRTPIGCPRRSDRHGASRREEDGANGDGEGDLSSEHGWVPSEIRGLLEKRNENERPVKVPAGTAECSKT